MRPVQFIAIALLLGAIAATAHPPASSDRQIYQQIGQHVVVFDCHDVHCFRPLVAVVLEHLPGPSLLKWKVYAVLANAAAALAVGRLCLVLGLSRRMANIATWIAAFGSGPMQSVFDPYTSDPLMYLLGPLMMADLLEDRIVRPGLVGCVGVFAKEFAAVPLWIAAAMAVLQRRWEVAGRTLLAAMTATLVWLALHTWLMTMYNYHYGQNASVDLLGGGYFAAWVAALGWPLAALYLFISFGPLFVLMAIGLRRATPTMRLLALASTPAVAAFLYVQQPDRALWNFQFVVIPIAMLVLAELPDWMCLSFVVCFAAANLRLGQNQPTLLPVFRSVMLVASLVLAMVAASRARRTGNERAAVAPSQA